MTVGSAESVMSSLWLLGEADTCLGETDFQRTDSGRGGGGGGGKQGAEVLVFRNMNKPTRRLHSNSCGGGEAIFNIEF